MNMSRSLLVYPYFKNAYEWSYLDNVSAMLGGTLGSADGAATLNTIKFITHF